ncbi:MAG: PEP-CTERM sorting domain-containing protein [Verrucomicrobiota bacterium]
MIAPVPEPSTYGAIFLGIGLGLVAYRRHRATKKAA